MAIRSTCSMSTCLCHYKSTRGTCEMANRPKKGLWCTKMAYPVHTGNCSFWDPPFYSCMTLRTEFFRPWPLKLQAKIIIIIGRNPCLLVLQNLNQCKCAFSQEVIPWASRPEGGCNYVTPLEAGIWRDIGFNIPKFNTKRGCVQNNGC